MSVLSLQDERIIMLKRPSHDGELYNVYRTSVQFDLNSIIAIFNKRYIRKIVTYHFHFFPEGVTHRIYRRSIRFPLGRAKIHAKGKLLTNLTLQAGDYGESA